MNKGLILKVLCLCIVSALIGGIVVYAQTPTTTMVLSGGNYPGGNDYTIFTTGPAEYYAKDSLGTIAYSGSDAEDVFNYAYASKTTTHVCSGDYYFTDQWYINETASFDFDSGVYLLFYDDFSPMIKIETCSQVALVCEGDVRVQNVEDEENRVFISINESSYVSLRNFYMDGESVSGCVGIEFYANTGAGTSFCDIQSCRLYGFDIGINYNFDGTGYHNRNRFYNIYMYDCGVGALIDGGSCSGNTFVSCEFAHCETSGLQFNASSAGGNNFYGCTWDTNDKYAIDISDTTHKCLKITDATIWHVGTGDAINGNQNAQDRFRGITGQSYSEFAGTSTITAGQYNVVIALNMWKSPSTVLVTPTTYCGNRTLIVSAKNSTHITVAMDYLHGSDINFMYQVFVYH